ncbi:hypothetical protein PVK73_28370 [Bacillus thuringiensis]
MNKKSKLSHTPAENTESNVSSTASSLTQQGYTKKQGCNCGKKKG